MRSSRRLCFGVAAPLAVVVAALASPAAVRAHAVDGGTETRDWRLMIVAGAIAVALVLAMAIRWLQDRRRRRLRPEVFVPPPTNLPLVDDDDDSEPKSKPESGSNPKARD